jgi:hypothetical protein
METWAKPPNKNMYWTEGLENVVRENKYILFL